MGFHKRQLHRSRSVLDLFRHFEHNHRPSLNRHPILDTWKPADAPTSEDHYPGLLLLPHIVSRPLVTLSHLLTNTIYRSTIAATAIQIYYTNHEIPGSADLTFDLWQVVLWTEIVQAVSLITACIPYLKPFLEALETGMIRADGGATRRKGLSEYGSSQGSRGYQKQSSSSNGKKSRSRDPEALHQDSIAMGNFHPGDMKTQTATVSARGRGPAESDADSQSSQSKIIKKQIDWTLTDETNVPHAV